MLYAFAVGFSSGTIGTVDLSSQVQQDNRQIETVQSGFSTIEFCHTTGTGFSYNVITVSSPSPFNKNNFTDYTEFTQAEENALKTSLYRYHFFSKNLVPRLSKYNLLFPFHYFS